MHITKVKIYHQELLRQDAKDNYKYLLEGKQEPDHAEIARFRTKHFVKCSQSLLFELEQITTTEVFIDCTKIEVVANKYTFVCKKAVTKHQAWFLRKTALFVGDIIERNLKPLWQNQVKKKHVKKLLKHLK